MTNQFHEFWCFTCFAGLSIKTYQFGPKEKGNIHLTFWPKAKQGRKERNPTHLPQPSKSTPQQ